jgi:predicted AAA+ superfamily ATPase
MRRYTGYLEISFQALLLPSWQRNPAKRLAKMPRIHFMDPGICRAVSGDFETTGGGLFESAVCAEIHKQVRYAEPDWSLYHLRTSDGREVDLLVETPHGYVAVEIKMSATSAQSQTRHFRDLEELLDKPFLGGLLLTQDRSMKYFEETRAIALPAAMALAPG